MWTRDHLIRLQSGAGRGFSRTALARSAQKPLGECDLALWLMMGRQPIPAILAKLNATATTNNADGGRPL